MYRKYKEKTISGYPMEACTAEFIALQLERAKEEKVNVVHFEFGTISKVSFDVLVYRN